MARLIDVAGWTGFDPVRSLLCAALGSNDHAIVQPIEIRYRNDQHHALLGLQLDEGHIVGLVGVERRPKQDEVEILHLAVSGTVDASEVIPEMIALVLQRRRQQFVLWPLDARLGPIAESLGFEFARDLDGGRLIYRLSPS